MLYATTRSNVDIYTAQRVMKEDRAGDGGLFVPMTLPPFLPHELRQFAQQPPSDTMAAVLSRFFPGTLSGKTLEFSAGKEFCANRVLSYKIEVSEWWKNSQGSLERLAQKLCKAASEDYLEFQPGDWAQIAVRIGLLAAVWGEMSRNKLVSAANAMDVSVAGADDRMVLAAWYARKMGLPIHKIIVCCNENNFLWDLLNRGQIRCSGPVTPTCTPRYDHSCRDTVERLIYGAFGRVESNRFAQSCQKNTTFFINGEQQRVLEDAIYVSVLGNRRVQRAVSEVYGSFRQVLCPYSALCYCGILDYRAETGARNPALLPVLHSPMEQAQAVTEAMGISEAELKRRLNLK